MDKFTSLLISTCNIQQKNLSLASYEQTVTWTTIATSVPTRKDAYNNASISDGSIRQNTDDDLFFFTADVQIARGNRIVFLGENYDVINVKPSYDSIGIHHLEVLARIVDND